MNPAHFGGGDDYGFGFFISNVSKDSFAVQ
jgi:hypothetical protein